MPRINRLVIPLRQDERKTIDKWAKRERLPTATLARKVLLDLAAARGIPERPSHDT